MKTALYLGIAALGWVPQASFAQAGAADSQAATQENAVPLGEIIVTAERQSQTIQRVPAAITAVDPAELLKTGVFDQSQLSKLVPGLQIGAQGGNGVAFLRGVGQTQGSPNTQPGVSLNLNGVYLPRESGTTPLFDMERVEVLPGPQGTLWGRNAAGGAINFITRRPVFETEAEGSAEYGNYDAFRATAALNLHAGDTLAVRLAGERQSRDGYLANGANDRDSYSGRLSVLLKPSERFTAFIVANLTREGGIGSQSVLYSERGLRGPFNPSGDIYNQTFATNLLRTDRDINSVTGEFTYALSDTVDLTYVPGFVDIDSDEVIQFQGRLPSRLVRTVSQYSHELRLSGRTDRVSWVLGGFAYDAKHNFMNTVRVDLPTPVGTVRFRNDLTSRAVFGQATFSVLEGLRFTAGGRYSSDEFDGFARTATPPRSEAAPLIGMGRKKDDRVDYKVGVEYDLSSESMVYGTVQTGYLIGGFLQNGGLYAPAELTAYTVGTKNRFLNRTVTANLEFYYYDYKNYQLQLVQGTNFLSVSSPARIFGAQMDLAFRPTPDDDLAINGAVQNAEIRDRTPATANLFIRSGVPVSIFGYDLPNAPRVTINASWTHRFELANGGRIETLAQTYYSSGYWMVFTQDVNTRQGKYTNTDLTLTYRAPADRWSVSAFVRNLEDKAVFVGANKPQVNDFSAPYVNAPRTYGARVEFKF